MRLEYLFHVEIRFKEFFFSRGSVGSDPHVYCLGEGLVQGERLQGTMRWTNRARRREDGKRIELGKLVQHTGTWLPHFDGVIRTYDGVEVPFSMAGYNVSTGIRDARHHRAITGRITFSCRDNRYLWLNNIYGLVLGRGSWPVDEENAIAIQSIGRYKDDEVWQLSGFSLVNEMTSSRGIAATSNSQAVRSGIDERIIPRYTHLFDGDLIFTKPIQLPTTGDNSDWVGYAIGEGATEGEDLKGKASFTVISRRRLDGVWLSHLSGKIMTNAGATVLVTFRGYTFPTAEGSKNGNREIVGSIALQTKDGKLGRLNRAFGLVEGQARFEGDDERWRIRAFQCVNPFEL